MSKHKRTLLTTATLYNSLWFGSFNVECEDESRSLNYTELLCDKNGLDYTFITINISDLLTKNVN